VPDRRVRAANPDVLARRAIPDGSDWKDRSASRVHRARQACQARLVRKGRAGKLARRANPERPELKAPPVRAAKPDRPVNYRRSSR